MYDDFEVDGLEDNDLVFQGYLCDPVGRPTGMEPNPDEYGAFGIQVRCKYGCAYFELDDVNITGRHGYEVTFQCPICNEYQAGKIIFLE